MELEGILADLGFSAKVHVWKIFVLKYFHLCSSNFCFIYFFFELSMKNYKSILETSFAQAWAQGWCHNTNIFETRCDVWPVAPARFISLLQWCLFIYIDIYEQTKQIIFEIFKIYIYDPLGKPIYMNKIFKIFKIYIYEELYIWTNITVGTKDPRFVRFMIRSHCTEIFM